LYAGGRPIARPTKNQRHRGFLVRERQAVDLAHGIGIGLQSYPKGPLSTTSRRTMFTTKSTKGTKGEGWIPENPPGMGREMR